MRVLNALMAATAAVPFAMTLAAAPMAYVPNFGSGTVSVIDTGSDTVVATIANVRCVYSVAVHSASQRAYFPNHCDDRLEVVDTSSNALLAPVPLPSGGALGVAVNAAGDRVFVVNFKDSVPNRDGGLVIIDVCSHPASVLAEVAIGEIPQGGVVVHPDGHAVYVASDCFHGASCQNKAMISIISTAAPFANAPAFIGSSPDGIAINSDGSRLYVAGGSTTGYQFRAITTIDTETLATEETLIPGGYAIAVHPENNRVYVTNSCSDISCSADDDGENGEVLVLSGEPLTMVASSSVGFFPRGISIHPDGSRVYASNLCTDNAHCGANSTVSIINAVDNTSSGTITVGGSPAALGQFLTRPVADLAVAATSANPSRRVGQIAHFTVGINNAGPDDSVATHLGLRLDAAMASMSVSAPVGWTCTVPVLLAAATTTTCSSNQVANGASPIFNVSALLGDEQGGKTLTLAANVSSVAEDTAPGDNRDSAGVQVLADANLRMSVAKPSDSLRSEVQVPVVFRLDNNGPNAAVHARVLFTSNLPPSAITMTAPSSWSCMATSGTTAGLECLRDGALASDERVRFPLLVTPPGSMAGRYLVVNGTSSSDTADPGAGNNQSAFKAMVRPTPNAIPVTAPIW